MWVGSPASLIDDTGYGDYGFEVYSKGGRKIFSRGFNSLFQEWTTTAEAKAVSKAYSQCLWMPFPKDSVQVVVYEQNRHSGAHEEFFSFWVDPSDKLISRERENDFKVTLLQDSGDPLHKMDLLFAAEGYTADRMDKLRSDALEFMEYMFSFEPYKSRRGDINVWLCESISPEGGVDLPHKDIWVNSLMDAGFYTFYTDRYLTISDHSKIASAVSGAPFDALFILVDSDTYGGGGIFNSYAMGTAGHKYSKAVFIHEFGHSFAGLADEYSGDSAYEEGYYPKEKEPWEPNITNLVDFSSKWKDLVSPSTPVPTPAEEGFSGTVGVYEGAGYVPRGMYRPYVECRMLNNTAPAFCPVCVRAIDRMIDFYTR